MPVRAQPSLSQVCMLVVCHDMTLCNINYHSNIVGDFLLSHSQLTFNSSNAKRRLCGVFDPVGDTIVEDNELFTFQTAAANSLDYIVGEDSIFQLTLFDNDGKIILTINV